MGLSTYVLPETGCYSACSFVFFAGKERKADGALGVHQVWGDDTDASTAQTVVSDILEAFVDFGVRQEVTSAMLRTRPEDMYVFSQSELERWGINAGDPMAQVAAAPPPSEEPPVVSIGPNISVVEQTTGRSVDGKTRTVPVLTKTDIGVILRANGFSDASISDIEVALRQGGISTLLDSGAEVRIMYGPARDGQSIPYRVMIQLRDETVSPVVGVALSDTGHYVLVRGDEEGVANAPSDGKGPRHGSLNATTHYVMLTSQKSEEEARQTAATIVSRFGPLFQGAALEVQRVDLGGKGIYYRVRVPANSFDDANAICTDVKNAGGDCFVIQ